MDTQKCNYVISYCKDVEATFIKTLPGYVHRRWDDLKDDLFSYYPSKDEDEVYHTKDLQ